jgi:sporulation protein YlmC with PRC-barrel domain
LGELADLVIDPARRRVTHLVVRPDEQKALIGSRLVPVELADSGEGQAEITLGCTLEDVGKLEPVQEVAYLRTGGLRVDDPDWEVGVSEVLAAPYYGPSQLGEVDYPLDSGMAYDRIPKGEVEIRRASSVNSSDGHHLGHVEAFIVDESEQVTHFTLEHGHLWGKREVTIPVGAVERIETDVVTLALSKDEVGALPAVRVRRW